MSTKDIRPTDTYTACDVCGRTLLRGERSEVFIAGGVRRSVCELCKGRALHEGWMREGALPEYGTAQPGTDRRRSLLGRLRRRERAAGDGEEFSPTLDDALSGEWAIPDGYADAPAEDPALPAPSSRGRRTARPERERPERPGPGGRDRRAGRPSRRDRTGRGGSEHDPSRDAAERTREPRHVRAVPSSGDHKVASALEMFNRSEHPRTVAGVARSLGAPVVAVTPDPARPSLVHVVTSWELCWYRYEVDLSEDVSSVRLDGQGYELDELGPHERIAAAAADESGRLSAG